MLVEANDGPTGTEPLPERTIRDVETLRAISDPLRLRILEVMTAAPDETFTVKRLASLIGTNATKLYHHVNVLLERDLVTVASQRVVSGIIETSYRVGQLNLSLDRALLAADTPVMHEALTTIFDGARDDIERALRAGVVSLAEDAPVETRLVLARGLARLDPAAAVAFRERLVALFEEFGADGLSADGHAVPARPAYGLLLGFYPMADPAETDEETLR